MITHKRKTLNLENIQYDKEGYPIFGKGILKEPVICVRPGHKTSLVQIQAEEKDGKLISHNYGHSGVGWSILFGTVEKAIENFEKLNQKHNLNSNEEITIIGLGVIGLVTALTLFYRGYKNIKLIGEKFLNTASFNAGGLIEFSLSTIYQPEKLEYMNKLFKTTFEEYRKIETGKHEFINSGVKEVDYYTDYYQENAGLHYLAELGLIPKFQRVILQLGEKEETNRELFHFRTYHVSTYVIMNNLLDTCKKLSIPIEYKKLKSINEVSTRIVFNCTGMGSKELNNDDNMYPICGHGFVLNEESISNHDYIIRLTNVPELEGRPEDGPIHFMPKTSGFVGGTYLKNYDGSDEKYNKELIKNLMIRARLIFQGVKPHAKPKF